MAAIGLFGRRLYQSSDEVNGPVNGPCEEKARDEEKEHFGFTVFGSITEYGFAGVVEDVVDECGAD